MQYIYVMLMCVVYTLVLLVLQKHCMLLAIDYLQRMPLTRLGLKSTISLAPGYWCHKVPELINVLVQTTKR